MDPERAPAAPIGGIRQDLSAIDFDRSMDVRSHFAFIDRPKLRGTREHTPARPSPRRATVRASDDLPPPLLFWPSTSARTLLMVFGGWALFTGVSHILAARRANVAQPSCITASAS